MEMPCSWVHGGRGGGAWTVILEGPPLPLACWCFGALQVLLAFLPLSKAHHPNSKRFLGKEASKPES